MNEGTSRFRHKTPRKRSDDTDNKSMSGCIGHIARLSTAGGTQPKIMLQRAAEPPQERT